MGKMAAGAILLGFALLGFIMGAIVMFIVYNQFVAFNAPESHKDIVAKIEIIDAKSGYRLKPRCVDAGSKTYGAGALQPLAVRFNFGEKYPQSTWIWQREGDTEFVMTIWGPDESGNLYAIELGRVGSGAFIIKFSGETRIQVSEVDLSEPKNEGYYYFEVRA